MMHFSSQRKINFHTIMFVDENPHAIIEPRNQHQLSERWAGCCLGDYLIRSELLPNNLNDELYLEVLELFQ